MGFFGRKKDNSSVGYNETTQMNLRQFSLRNGSYDALCKYNLIDTLEQNADRSNPDVIKSSCKILDILIDYVQRADFQNQTLLTARVQYTRTHFISFTLSSIGVAFVNPDDVEMMYNFINYCENEPNPDQYMLYKYNFLKDFGILEHIARGHFNRA